MSRGIRARAAPPIRCCRSQKAHVAWTMYWDLLDRYLGGECTIVERAEVERWLAESPDRQGLLEQLTTSDPVAARAKSAEIRARLKHELGLGLKLGGNGV